MDNRSTGWVKYGDGYVRICKSIHICIPKKLKKAKPQPPAGEK